MASEKSKFLKFGCIGCLGVLAFLFVVSAAVVGTAFMQSRNDEATDRTLERPVPGFVERSQEVPSDSSAAKDPSGGIADRRDDAAATFDFGADTQNVGRIRLDLSGGAFKILPAEPGSPIRVEARFDEKRGRLVEQFTEDDGDGWTYSVTFEQRSSGLIDTLRMMLGGSQPEVAVYLPRDVPLELVLDISQGGAEAELGALWLTEGDFTFQQGGINVNISEPMKQPMNRLRLEGSMGGFNMSMIGNASPKILEVDGSMGGVALDLRGNWRTDSEIDIQVRMGGCEVRLPQDVQLEGLDEFLNVRAPDRDGLIPVLRFHADPNGSNTQFIY